MRYETLDVDTYQLIKFAYTQGLIDGAQGSCADPDGFQQILNFYFGINDKADDGRTARN